MFKAIERCRSCACPDLDPVLDLGSIHINAFPAPGEPDSPVAPLALVICRGCHLVQLRHTVQPDLLYRHFWYRSSMTHTMREALLDVVVASKQRAQLRPGDAVIDIGSNDSTLLRHYPPGYRLLGFEPATNLMDVARFDGATIVNDYFTRAAAAPHLDQPARIITAIAMFYDLDDPNAFVSDVRACLAADGVFVVQQAYLPVMLGTNDFANVCHEHLEYYSLTSLLPLLERHGLYVWDAEVNDINGGSIRTYASPTRREPTPALKSFLDREKQLDLAGRAPYQQFAADVEENKRQVLDLVARCRKSGPVYVYGASTKGNTMLQYWGLGRAQIEAAAERDPRKYGRETVGTRIPIVPEKEARAKARTFLVLPWPFKNEMVRREEEWLKAGGQMIFPLPRVELVTAPARTPARAGAPRPH